MARLVAYIIQTHNEGKINGHCLKFQEAQADDQYDFLLATPFDPDCIEVKLIEFLTLLKFKQGIDWIILIMYVLSMVASLIFVVVKTPHLANCYLPKV